jgi:hypothetical protein
MAAHYILQWKPKQYISTTFGMSSAPFGSKYHSSANTLSPVEAWVLPVSRTRAKMLMASLFTSWAAKFLALLASLLDFHFLVLFI